MNAGRIAMGALSLALWLLALLAVAALSERLSLELTVEVLVWNVAIAAQALLGVAAGIAVHRFSPSAPLLIVVLGALVVISRLTYQDPIVAEPWSEVILISLELAGAFAAAAGFAWWQISRSKQTPAV